MGLTRGIEVAVLFFGLPRASDVCMPSVEAQVLEPLRSDPAVAGVTLYHHLYRQGEVHNPRSGESGALADSNYDWFEASSGSVLPMSSFEESRLDSFARRGDAFGDENASTRNLLMQLQSIQHATRRAAERPFDVAIFLRPDLKYHDPLPLRAVHKAARDPSLIVVPSWQWWYGCNDRFAICGRRAALAYGHRADAAEAFCADTGEPLNGEQLVQYVVAREDLRLRVMSMRASRVRLHGIEKAEEFRPDYDLMGGRPRRYHLRWLRLLSRY